MALNKTKQNIVKNQHYIPKPLLGYFTNLDGKFFEVLLATKNIYLTNPINSMSAKFIYEDDYLKVNTVENYFGRIETEVVPLIKELIETIEKYKKNEIEFALIKTAIEDLLSIYIVFYYRSGALLAEFSSINLKDKIPLLSKKILNQNYVNALAETIKYYYKFAIIECDRDFLMSDQFISTAALKIKTQFANISNRHIGIKETLILIPISSSYYAVYWHTDSNFFLKENTLNKLNKEKLKSINQTIISNAYIKCIGAKKENLKTVLNNYDMEFPSQVYIGHRSGDSSGYIKKKEVFFYDIDKQAYNILSHHIRIQKYLAVRRNDLCPCKSGKKFKKCHNHTLERIKIPIQNLMSSVHLKQDIYRIPGVIVVELPIDEWGPYTK